jgi:hypothetical protein
MRDDGLTRPKWVERQFLRPQDFIAEQRYHLVDRWRHNIGLHSWGIAEGLEIRMIDGTPTVQPGMAIDGYGRELVLAIGRPIQTTEFDRLGTDQLHLWLAYRVLETDPPPAGFTVCREDEDAADSPYRWTELPMLVVTDGVEDIDPRNAPLSVPMSDLPFEPSRAFPVDGALWPVFLGGVTRNRDSDPMYEVDSRLRPYAGIVAGSVVHPDGRTRIELGSEDEPGSRFSLATLDSSTPPALVSRIELVDLPKTDDKPEEVALVFQEDLIVEGDVSLTQGTLWFKGPIESSAVAQKRNSRRAGPGIPNISRPWQIYRYNDEEGGNTLRIEIGNQENSKFEIGTWDDDAKQFKACLTVDSQCNVTVGGDLIVEGKLDPQGGIDPATPSAEAQQLIELNTATRTSSIASSILSGAFGLQIAQLVGQSLEKLEIDGDSDQSPEIIVK